MGINRITKITVQYMGINRITKITVYGDQQNNQDYCIMYMGI